MSTRFQPISNPIDPDKIENMSKYTSPEMRQKCWDARDKCFDCLDNEKSKSACQDICRDFFSGEYCLQSWIKHFTKRRRYSKAWDLYKQSEEAKGISTRADLQG